MNFSRTTIIYWVTFFLTFVLYQFGFTITVSFGDEPIPFATIWNSAEWHRAFHMHSSDDYFHIFLAGFLTSLLLPFLKMDRSRVTLLGIVTFIGMAHFDFVMLLLTIYSPWIVASESLGYLDGESYSEGIDQAGAAGLLLLCGFLSALRYFWYLFKNREFSANSCGVRS